SQRVRRLGDGATTIGSARRRPPGCSPAEVRPYPAPLCPEFVRARDVRVIGLELGVEPARRPAAELRHAPPDRLRAVLSLTAAGADAGAPQQDVLQRDGQLVLHRVVQLMDRKRPRSSATTLCARETSDSRLPFSNESGRTPAYVYTTSSSATRESGRTLRTSPRRYATSSPVACRRSRSPLKSVSVAPISENSRHGMTKIIRSSRVE